MKGEVTFYSKQKRVTLISKMHAWGDGRSNECAHISFLHINCMVVPRIIAEFSTNTSFINERNQSLHMLFKKSPDHRYFNTTYSRELLCIVAVHFVSCLTLRVGVYIDVNSYYQYGVIDYVR